MTNRHAVSAELDKVAYDWKSRCVIKKKVTKLLGGYSNNVCVS